jgi:hypothetical protein
MKKAIPLAMLGAVAMAGALTILYELGLYLVMVVPILAASGSMFLMRNVVEYSHCRNQRVAMLIATIVGAIACLGYYQFRLAYESGWEALFRVDLLPRFIWDNWTTQVIVSLRHANRPPDDLSFIGNILLFFVEVLVIFGVGIAAGHAAASRVYSEDDACWTESYTRNVVLRWGLKIEVAIQTGLLPMILRQLELQPIPDPQNAPPHTRITLEYSGDGSSNEVYMTVISIPNRMIKIVSQLRLTPEEIDACRPLFLPYPPNTGFQPARSIES